MIVTESESEFETTVERLTKAIAGRGLTLFCRVDHAAGAHEAGLELAPEEVFPFGNPQAGTLLMQKDASVGYELPLRILVWQVGERVRLGHRDPRELTANYELGAAEPVLERTAALLTDITTEAGGK